MTPNNQSDKKIRAKGAHGPGDLFSEWPTQSDIVEGFGGNPRNAADKQWKQNKDISDTKQ